MEHREPTPKRQAARVSPTVELLAWVGPFTIASAFCAVGAVYSVLHRAWLAFAMLLVMALVYAARVVARVRKIRRRRDGHTAQTSKILIRLGLSETTTGQYYYCLEHHRVETDDDKCPEEYLLGPYATHGDAARALEKVRERNDAWDAEDERWNG